MRGQTMPTQADASVEHESALLNPRSGSGALNGSNIGTFVHSSEHPLTCLPAHL
jgi:hypothetical protein